MKRRIALFIWGIPVGLLLGFALTLTSLLDKESFESGYRTYRKIWESATEDNFPR